MGKQQVLWFALQAEVDTHEPPRDRGSIKDVDVEARHLPCVGPVLIRDPVPKSMVRSPYFVGDCSCLAHPDGNDQASYGQWQRVVAGFQHIPSRRDTIDTQQYVYQGRTDLCALNQLERLFVPGNG